MTTDQPKISSIVLAAGASSRLNGEPKQLLEFRGKTFLRRVVETARAANFHSLVVVLGANSEKLRREVEDLSVKVVVNENWATGMGSSIQTGLAELLREESLDGVAITLCDQPLVTSETLLNLCDVFARTGKPIVACEYENTIGVPALFSSEIFAELMNLRESEGAKKIIEKYKRRTALVAAPEAALDVDTLEDYEQLKRMNLVAQ